MKIINPIIRGFYPDPSICKAGEKYYMVCSSFQYFPGVPLFESEDLVNWKQIGHCLTRSSQIDLEKVNSSGGVFAPTIRYNNGVFYMVTTNDTYHKNFYVTTTDIYGEWSEPIFVDQGGIDPSLYFEDGKTYFMSNGSDEEGRGCIYQCEIDVKTGKRLTESKPIWKGSGGRYLESPHLYKIDGNYYIMAAEGGTEYGHMITYAKGNSPYGPFVSYDKNPVLTNRNLGGHQSKIQGIGHGDIVINDEGKAFIFCLGFRQHDTWSPYHHLGREVFLAPIYFNEDGWFTAGCEGIVKKEMEVELKNKQNIYDYSVDFETLSKNKLHMVYLRKPEFSNYEWTDDCLKLRGCKTDLSEALSPTFVGIRQSDFNTSLSVEVKALSSETGITVYMDENNHYDLYVSREDEKFCIVFRKCLADIKHIEKAITVSSDSTIILEMNSNNYSYIFSCKVDGESIELGSGQARYLSSEVCGGFTGVVVGLFAVDKTDEPKFSVFTKFKFNQEKGNLE